MCPFNGVTEDPVFSADRIFFVTSGTISKVDYDNFNSKLDSVVGESLASGQIWVGDGLGAASEVAMSGDATMDNAGALTIANNASRAGLHIEAFGAGASL